MKKILWLSHFLPYPPKGGMLQRSYNLLKEISKNHEVTLLAFNQSKLCVTKADAENAFKHLGEFCKIAGLVDIESEKSSFNKLKLLLGGFLPGRTYTLDWLKSSNYSQVLADTLGLEKFDIIHVDTISLVPYVMNLSAYKRVLNHHNIESLMLLRRSENEKNMLKKLYFFYEGIKLKKYEKKVCPVFDLNITCSNLDSERLNSFSPDSQCLDIPNGVDLAYFKSTCSTAIDKSIIFAGGLSWYPNLDAMTFFLKEVWPRLSQEIPDVTMTVVGRSPAPWMAELQNVYPNLKVTGFVDDVRPYFDAAFLYVCPIRDGGGTKLKVLDALAMKKTLISHSIACEGIDVVENESVVFAETADEYINQIKSLFDNRERALMIAENGYKVVSEKYDFVKVGERLSSAYENL